jgi:Ca2+-binding EF-hand superfamily protein
MVANNGYAMDADVVSSMNTLTSEISTNTSAISSNDGEISANASAISTNAIDISTNLNSINNLAPVATDGNFSDLYNIPAGLADGDDDTQLSDAQVQAIVTAMNIDTDTTLNATEVRAMISAGTGMSYDAATGELSTTIVDTDTQLSDTQVQDIVTAMNIDTDTTLSDAQVQAIVTAMNIDTDTTLNATEVRAMISAGTGMSYDSATGELSTTITDTDTNLSTADVVTMVSDNGFIAEDSDGRVAIGTVTPTTNSDILLQVGGSASIEGAVYISGGSDLAEGFHINESEKVTPGTVVSIDPNDIGKLKISNEAYDRKVAGVVSGANGIDPGIIMTQTGTLADGEYPIALTGRVWVKCSGENGDVEVGDLLTTGNKPGHAMKADKKDLSGAILGKAMSSCTSDNMVLTLISLQ